LGGQCAHGPEGQNALGGGLLGADDDHAGLAAEADVVEGAAEGVARRGAGGDEAADGAADAVVRGEVEVQGAGDG